MRANKRPILIILVLITFTVVLSRCINLTESYTDHRGKAYAGAFSCMECHKAIYDSMLLSAHYNATTASTKETVHGSFKEGFNKFVYDEHITIAMEDRDSGLYQVVYTDGKETSAYRFDISFGLQHAQTWLYWDNNNAFELPVSWYRSVNTWATSPGYSQTKPDFRRFIGRDCFECHSSYIKSQLDASTAGIKETLVPSSIIYGIDCERCHGPAANHVNYHLENPDEKIPRYITRFSSLSRQQQLDACALCHSGNDKMKIESRFKFRPGDSLANFFESTSRSATANFDVHGNQYRLLAESKCFISGNTITCTTCHDPHRNASNDLSFYSQKCMSCHSEANHNFCPMATQLGNSIKQNCIDCHMPKQSSQAISFHLQGINEPSSYLLRTHKIAIYAGEVNKMNKKDPTP